MDEPTFEHAQAAHEHYYARFHAYGAKLKLEDLERKLKASPWLINTKFRHELEIARIGVAYTANTEIYWEQKLLELQNKYDPNQPRVHAGNPDGGQWTYVGGYARGKEQQDFIDYLRIGRVQVADSGAIGSDALSDKIIIDRSPNGHNDKTLIYPDGNSIIDPNTGKPYIAPQRLDILKDIREAEHTTFEDAIPSMIQWFQHFGSKDYQREGNTFYSRYRNVTNFTFGAVASATGFTLDATLFAADLFSRLYGTKKPLTEDASRNISHGWHSYKNGLFK